MKAEQQANMVYEVVEQFYDKMVPYDPTLQGLNKKERDHVIHIGTSILCTKWNVGWSGGSFVQSVVDNDLMGAVGRADSTNIKVLPFYCKLMYNVGMPMELSNLS